MYADQWIHSIDLDGAPKQSHRQSNHRDRDENVGPQLCQLLEPESATGWMLHELMERKDLRRRLIVASRTRRWLS